MYDFLNAISPIEFIDDIYLKRNDKLSIFNLNGGKVQGAYYLIQKAMQNGYNNVVSLGSRFSPQCYIISNICENIGINCHLFIPFSKCDTNLIKIIEKNSNTNIYRIKYGYTSNLIYNAKKFSKLNNYYFIPFGMKCYDNIDIISKQVSNIPKNIKRIIVPVGSGNTFLGILKGLNDYNRIEIKLIGIYTGSDASKYIYANIPIMNKIKFELKYYKSELTPSKRYEKIVNNYIGNIKLNERYEGKCFEFLEKNDLLWIVGS